MISELIKETYLYGVFTALVLQVINIASWAYVFRKTFTWKWFMQTFLWTIVLLVFSWAGALMIFFAIFRRLRLYKNWHIK